MQARLATCLIVAVALPARARHTGAHHDQLVELLREGPPASLESSMYQRYKDYLADGTEPGHAAVIEAWNRPGGTRRRTQGTALYEALELAEASMEEVQGWSSEDHLHEYVDEEVASRHEGSDWDGGCDDPLASSSTPDGACVYTCPHLVEHYFPGSQDAARCFLYDSTSGWPAELLELKRDRLDIYAYPQTAVDDTIVFTIGKGRNCSNVTVVTTTFASTGHEPVEISERFCLIDGEHEHEHTVEDTHSVDVVGYASSGVQRGAGNTTAFVIGSCTDVLLRVITTGGGSAPVTWSLNDEFHNGPWTLETSGVGVVEHPSCMFDNVFTLSKSSADWVGTVEIVGYVQYHGSIQIPENEKWIIQGQLGLDSLPVQLDARIVSGSPQVPSSASIIVRRVRFSGQQAALTYIEYPYPWMSHGEPRVGGAFVYEGGGMVGEVVPEIRFEQVIWDHNFATTGAAFFINGRPETMSAISLVVDGCLFFRNFMDHTGAFRVNNVWPLTAVITDSDLFETFGFHATIAIDWWIPVTSQSPGNSSISLTRLRLGHSGKEMTSNWTPFGHITSTGGLMGPNTEGHVAMNLFVEDCSLDDVQSDICNGLYTDEGSWNAYNTKGDEFNVWIRDTNFINATGSVIPAGGIGLRYWFVHGTVLYVLGGNNVLERVVFADCGLLPGDDAYSNGGGMIQVYFARLRLVSSAFRRNRMPRGGALHLGEDTAAEIVNCIFSENVAVISGGAISFDGMGTLDIASSTFVSNAVRTLAWASTVSVTVRLFPGLLFDVGSVPIWRIDDGPVHGLEYVQCESARQASVSGVQRGLPESWPNSAESCANISYNQLTGASAAVVSLEQGAHTLWVGSYALCPGFVLSWGGGGWIEIIDYMAPRFPKAQIVDNRNADRYPGCNTAANCELVLEDVEGLNQDINGVPPCPVGEAFWTSYSFDASTGTGGALALENYNRVSLRDTSFKDNSAGVGAAVYALAIASMQIVNTTFSEESSSAVKLIGVQISTCVDEPCKLGERCTIRAVSRFCDPCRSNEISDGVVCRACERGTEPSSDRSSCVACQGQHTYSAGGICQVCEGLASPDHRFCNDCPAHMAPRHTGGCECESSRYNILSGVITCHTHDHQADAFEGDGYQVAAELYRNGRAGGLASICVPCPVCVDCTTSNDPPRIRAGYALTPSTVANGDFEQYGKDTSVYKCRPEAIDGRLNDQRVAAMVDAGELVDDDLAQCLGTHNRTAVCANGHTGTLCGECVSGYGRRRSNRCQLCSEAVTWLKLLNAVLAMVALLAAMFGFMVILTMCIGAPGEGGVPKQDLEEDAQTFVNPLDESSTPPNDSEAQRSASGAQSVIVKSRRLFVVATRMATQPIKIFISYWQIASQLGPVLHFQFPPMLSNLMDSFRWIVTGIQGVVATECLPGVHGYYSTFVLELVGYPLILLAGVLSYYVYIKRQQGDTIAVATLKNQAFGITFLCYPFMCNQLFGMLNCRDLNEQTVLAKDYSISCSTDVHWWFAVLSKLLIAAFAFGVPIGVMVAMKRSSDQEADAFGSSEWAYTIQRMAAQLKEDDVDTVRAAVIDVQLGKIYGSFVTAYKPSCFWWEGIDMLRKLLIIGVLSVVSQGSTFQICVGLITGFFFFAGHLLKLPFRHFEDNVLKATSELHIYLMLVLVLALKSDVSSETFDSDSYDIAATAMFVLFVPVALIGSIVSKFRTIVRDEIDAGTQSSQLDQVRAAFQRYKFSRDKWEDREVLGRFIDSMQAADTAALQEAGLFHTPDKALCTHQRRGGDVHPGTHVCEGEYRATAGDQPVKCAVKIRALITTLQAESGIRLECSHKNVCSMLFAAEVGDSHYLAMQLCTQSLERALRERKLGGNRVGVCRGIVEGLNALHSALFVHGNVTPANVLLDQSGIPKLSGFSSCAKVRQGDGGAKLCAARCTAGFTPPEVFNALDSDGFVDLDSPLAVDAFGLGCTVFAVLSGGDAAFGGSSKAEVQTNVEAARSNVETNGKVCPEGVNLCSGLTNLDPASRPTVGSVVAHPLFWTRNAAVEYLAGIGGILPVGIKRSQHPFVADLEDAMDENIGEYNETAPEDGGSWAAQLELQKAVPDWGTQRKPADEERNYYIFGAPPKKKQIQARDRLIADGKPLGSHEAKQVRSVGLLKFLRNVHAHRFEAVEGGRFESENEILGYLLDGFPWLLITVHTLDGKHGYGRSADEADTSSDGGDSTQSFLRMSFAANTQSARSLAATEE